MSEKKRSRDAGKWFREMKSELKKVVWPTLPQVTKNTGIVMAMVIIVALFIGIVDFALKLGVGALVSLG